MAIWRIGSRTLCEIHKLTEQIKLTTEQRESGEYYGMLLSWRALYI